MSKAIMISIKPKWVAKILNGQKTIEIRKTMPKCDLPIDVYIYCTKDKKGYLTEYLNKETNKHLFYSYDLGKPNGLNGKVVAKFTLNKVEEIELNRNHFVNEQYSTDELDYKELLEQSCLTYKELDDYLQCEVGYAWHISNLVIFDRPKELSEFRKTNTVSLKELQQFGLPYNEKMYKDMMTKGKFLLTKAPQSWCYVEVLL